MEQKTVSAELMELEIMARTEPKQESRRSVVKGILTLPIENDTRPRQSIQSLLFDIAIIFGMFTVMIPWVITKKKGVKTFLGASFLSLSSASLSREIAIFCLAADLIASLVMTVRMIKEKEENEDHPHILIYG